MEHRRWFCGDRGRLEKAGRCWIIKGDGIPWPPEPIKWIWPSTLELVCFFLAKDAHHKKAVEDLLVDHDVINKMLGKRVGFVVLCPPTAHGEQDDAAESVGHAINYIQKYKLSYKSIAERTTSSDFVNALIESFGILYSQLPCLVVISQILPESQAIVSLPSGVDAKMLGECFKELRSICDDVTYDPWHPESSSKTHEDIALISKIVSQAERLKSEINQCQNELGITVDKLRRRLQLNDFEYKQIVSLIGRNFGAVAEFDNLATPWAQHVDRRKHESLIRGISQKLRRLERLHRTAAELVRDGEVASNDARSREMARLERVEQRLAAFVRNTKLRATGGKVARYSLKLASQAPGVMHKVDGLRGVIDKIRKMLE